MKLKYYLNGFGIGVIFATIILSISFAVNINTIKTGVNDQAIEKRARELGMVYAEELQDTSSPAPTDSSEETSPESLEETLQEETLQEETESEEETSEQETETTQPETTQPETTREVSTVAETSALAGASGETVSFQIYSGDSSETVANRLQSNGIVENAAEFNTYVVTHGYATVLRVGTYEIEKGSSYEEIVKKICR